MDDTTTRTDQQLAMAALEKRRSGQKPSREETAALARVQKAREEKERREAFNAIRKKEWCEWSGRQVKVLNEQAARYGIPIGGPTIQIPAVARWVHDFLADHATVLAAAAGENGPDVREELVALKVERERIALVRDRKNWMPRKDVRDGLVAAARLIRQAGEALLRQYGPGAKKILDDALDSVQGDCDRRFADDNADPAS